MSETNYMIARALIHLLVNVLIVWGTVALLRRRGPAEHKVVGEPRPVAMMPRQTSE